STTLFRSRHVVSVETNRLSDDRRGAREARLPELVRDDGDRFGARLRRLLGTEKAAERRTQAARREVVAGDEHPVAALDAARFADVERNHPERERLLDRSDPLAQIAVFEPRHADVHARLVARLDEMEGRGVANTGQRTEEDG